jgi:hypothetical protein
MMPYYLVRRRPLRFPNRSVHTSAVWRCQDARAVWTVANHDIGSVL